MRATGVLAVLCLVTLVLAGCGGSNPGAASATSTATSVGSAAPSGETAAAGLPAFVGDLDRVCETQVGFGGTAAYDATPGIHPVALFYDYGEPPSLIEASVTLPAGWAITQDANYADSSEFAALQLIACSRRTKAVPNGTMCDFTPSGGGTTTTLELTDTAYEMTVYAAATGQPVGKPKTLEASDAECPMIAAFKESDTRFLNTPTEDQYVAALKGFVAP
ncbi:MAG: hypothetical protein H0V73_12770 [Chloroflexi bacterium]|nr:hypothetical protein [Chloroflexota bacterium]